MAVKKEIITKFAIEYAMTTQSHPYDWWGARYGVTGKAIKRWLVRPEVAKIVDENVRSFSDMVVDKARKNVDIAMRELKKIVKMEKFTDVKRKACNDMLGIARIENINKDTAVKGKEWKKDPTKITDKELNDEYDKLLKNDSRKTESPKIAEKPASIEVN